MDQEFYHKNIFGDVVDIDLAFEEGEEDLVGPKGRSDFNIFALTDAVGARDKRNAWVLYRKALASGLAPEEVFYKVVWQVKSLLLAKNTSSATEAGMKPYPYSKAQGYLRNFHEGELENLSQNLVIGYHNARRGKGEMETFVEKTLLRL
ncbi:MAG: hypothetical protein WDZ61_00730 [Parcubacteria group bacterium]